MYNTEELLSKLRAETVTLHAQIARMKQRDGELVGALVDTIDLSESLLKNVAEACKDECILKMPCPRLDKARAALQSVAKEGEQ